MFCYAGLCSGRICWAMLCSLMSHWAVQCCTISYNAMLMLCCLCNFRICSAMFFTFMLLCCCSVTGCAHCAASVKHCSYLGTLVPGNVEQYSFALNSAIQTMLCSVTVALCHALLSPSRPMPARRCWSHHQFSFHPPLQECTRMLSTVHR